MDADGRTGIGTTVLDIREPSSLMAVMKAGTPVAWGDCRKPLYGPAPRCVMVPSWMTICCAICSGTEASSMIVSSITIVGVMSSSTMSSMVTCGCCWTFCLWNSSQSLEELHVIKRLIPNQVVLVLSRRLLLDHLLHQLRECVLLVLWRDWVG